MILCSVILFLVTIKCPKSPKPVMGLPKVFPSGLLYTCSSVTPSYQVGQHPWTWSCQGGRCEKLAYDPQSKDLPLSLDACMLFCYDYGLLFPQPTGSYNVSNFISKINPDKIEFEFTKSGRSMDLLEGAVKRFRELLPLSVPEGVVPRAAGKALKIVIQTANPDVREISLDLDEGYTLKVSPEAGDRVVASISANNFFGARHALETLSQFIIYDDVRNQILMVRNADIVDKPVYPYRGVLLDTSRNYFSVESIKRTIDGMAAVKLNTFHWHITDSHSFPFVSQRQPALSIAGAYSPRKVYTKADIVDIVEYGLRRGVRVLPELDAPAHVGEGWQDTGLTVCFRAEPWNNYCVEPPCGQLNPVKDELYSVLADIYQDMADWFQSDMFHMGGDEVSEKCWNSSTEIQNFMIQNRWGLDQDGFMQLWNYFQTKAQEKVYKVDGRSEESRRTLVDVGRTVDHSGKLWGRLMSSSGLLVAEAFGKKIPLVMWTSTLTDPKYLKYLNKDDYIIQIWTKGDDGVVQNLLQNGYKLIMSNYDALYLDCGFGAWVTDGNNWCSPYIGWQKVYENSPAAIAGEFKHLIHGGEAALWSEQADTSNLDARLWPRVAALAERLWAEPKTTWRQAEPRLLAIRERLVNMGIDADSVKPLWCLQNEGHCNI